ncbi:MAG: hypothetical protein AAB214_05160 [Fibrobacterota bacterium]
MRSFLIKTILFLLPVFLVGVCMEALLFGVPNEYRAKNDALARDGKQIHTLVLGSSHTYFGVDPDLMAPGVYNAAFVSQSLRYDSAILATRLDSLPKLNTVVIPISYFSLFFQLESGQAAALAKNYRLHLGIGSAPNPIERLEVVQSRLETSIDKIWMHYLDGGTPPACSPSGWGIPPTKGAPDMAASGRIEAARHIGYVEQGRKHHLSENVRCLESMLRICRSRGIRVFLVTLPATRHYSSLLAPSVWNEIRDTVGRIIAVHPGTTYFDYSDVTGFDDSDYFDADHLDSSGAAKFTARLAKSLDSATATGR